MIEKQSIHEKALSVLGAKARLEKLQEELIECANAANRLANNKGTEEELFHEIMDVQIVLRSVRLMPGFNNLLRAGFVAKHETEAYDKLQKAIDEKEVKRDPR